MSLTREIAALMRMGWSEPAIATHMRDRATRDGLRSVMSKARRAIGTPPRARGRSYQGMIDMELSDQVFTRICAAAVSYNTSPSDLMLRLVEIVVEENMFDAILDDPDSKVPR